MKCLHCPYCRFEMGTGYIGRWLCFHPYRTDLDDRGRFTFDNRDPDRTVCTTSPLYPCFHNARKWWMVKDSLRRADTPRWCFVEACKREREYRKKNGLPPFDPDAQRKLYRR